VSTIEGNGPCPGEQYLNTEFNKCCEPNQWYGPKHDRCFPSQRGVCPETQYINDRFNKCCPNNQYYHSIQGRCVNQ
jgi:hypothetical protein